MGDIADMILDGLLDEETGELIDGEAPGYPRSLSRDFRELPKRRAQKHRRFIPCPGCARHFGNDFALNQHRTAKDH